MNAAPQAHSAPERKSNFFLGFLLLPPRKRAALSAVYGYCRFIDDIVDSGHLKKDEAALMLDFWRAEVERLYEGRPTHSISLALLPHLEEQRLPKDAFLEMIRGCEMDLNAARYETPEDLESYMHGVASSVGYMSVEIFGYKETPRDHIREFARFFGYAFQLTNIIRDVGADLELGRVYLPAADMKAAGYSLEALHRREHSDAFVRLMEIQYQRAKRYYQRARNMVDRRDRKSLLPAEVMAHIYEGLLEEIRLNKFRVLFQKQSLSPWYKARLALKAWWYCHGF